LQATVTEVITVRGGETLDKFLKPDDDIVEPDEPYESAEPRWKKSRDTWEWEEEVRSLNSSVHAIFPGQYYTRFKNMSPVDLFDLFIGNNIFELIATKSNMYGMTKFRTNVAILAEKIRVFVAILILSGYNKVTDYKLYWAT
jgi:hypothetical protein